MKKIIAIFISIFLCLFILILLVVNNDNKYINSLKEKILDNTGIEIIKYINYYDNHYIVCDNDNLYLFNNEYLEILSINLNLLFDNRKNYDIVYKNKTLMYMDSYKNKEGIVFKYYDIYTGEVIDEIIVGGFYE